MKAAIGSILRGGSVMDSGSSNAIISHFSVFEMQQVTGKDLSRLLHIIPSYRTVDITLESAASAIIESAKSPTRIGFNYVYLPLMEEIVSKKVGCLLLDSQKPTDTGRYLVSTLLVRYVVVIIGPEPPKQQDWRQEAVGSCKCNDCKMVNDFVRSDKRMAGFKVGKARRVHLDRTFKYHPNASWTIEVFTSSNPHEWRMTKTSARDYTNKQWAEVVKEAKGKMKSLTKKGLTKAWLEHEEDFDDIVNLNAVQLKQKLESRLQKQGLDTHTLTEGGNRLKRAAEESVDSRPSKKGATGAGPTEETEVVDLTEE